MEDYIFHSVLNTDKYDRRTYTSIRNASFKVQDLEKEGSKELLTFPQLAGDIWAGLFKNTPSLVDEINPEVLPNKPIMERVFNHPEFQAMREYTKLDELASALGLLNLGSKLKDFLEKNLDDDAKQKAEEAQAKRDEAENLQARADAAQEAANHSKGEAQKKFQAEANNLSGKATAAKGQADKLAKEVTMAIEAMLGTAKGEQALTNAIVEAKQETKTETVEAQEMIGGGDGYGTGAGTPTKVDHVTAVKIADAIKNSPKLKKVAGLAGRLKIIATRKQKTKTRETVERSDVITGDDLSRILPAELALLSMPETRDDFIARLAEKKVLMYDQHGKEKLGKGPIVICIDESGSMKNLDSEAKAIAIALMNIARKQRRAFAVIAFSSARCIKMWEFPNSRKIKPNEVIEIIETFLGGGTDFMTPLDKAVSVINKDRFDKADVIFITDGDANVDPNWLSKFKENKARKKFQVISISLDSSFIGKIRPFSDKVITAKSLLDDSVTDVVFAI